MRPTRWLWLLGSCACGCDFSAQPASGTERSVLPPMVAGPAGSFATSPSFSAGTGGTIDMTAAGGAGLGTTMLAPEALPPIGLPDVEFKLDVRVPAGAELHECMYAQLPSDRGVIAVPSAESHYTAGSHHMLAYRTSLTAIPMGQTGVWDCASEGWMTSSLGSYYEAQQPDSMRSLPPGVAHLFQPGEVIVIESHYINTTSADLAAHVVFKLHTIDPATVKQEAGTIMFTDFNIKVAPHSKARVSMTCTLPQDINPGLLWSHMHKRASNFIATTDDPTAAAALGTLYQEPDWSEPSPREYANDPRFVLHSGSHITFSCDIGNDTDATLSFGQSAEKNEMCILHGMYWPRMPSAGEHCHGGTTTSTPL